MRTSVTALLGMLGGIIWFPLMVPAQTDTSTAIAVPLNGIVIDGRLDDWPAGLEKHWILHHGQVYGPTDIDTADLKTSADLSPSFMIGYSPEENLLYVAVTIRDDVLMSGYGLQATDGCEIYVEGTRKRKVVLSDFSRNFTPETMAAIQYTFCPPGGSYDSKQPGMPEPQNPRLSGGDIKKTKSRFAYSRQGDVSVYECAIEAFDRFPDLPTKLILGRTIGIDVVINDVDGPNPPAWVCWGTFKPLKFWNADSLGDVLIVDDPGKLGTVDGMITNSRDKGAFKGFEFEVYRAAELLVTCKADSIGRYRLQLPAGAYAIKPKSRQGVETHTSVPVTVKAGKETVVNFAPKPVRLPGIVEKSAGIYRNLTGYRDSTIIAVHTKSGTEERDEVFPYTLSFARPNMLRFECSADIEPPYISLYSDGGEMIVYNRNMKRYTKDKSPETLDISNMEMPVWQVSGNMIDLVFLFSENPLITLLDNVESIRKVGKDRIDGEPATVVEIVKAYDRFLHERRIMETVPVRPMSDVTGTVTMWFGNKDFLIKKMTFSLDCDAMSEGFPEQFRSMMKGKADVTVRHRRIELNPEFPDTAFVFEAPEGAMNMWGNERGVSVVPKARKLDGKPAPDFTLRDVDGKEMSVSSCRGNVVILEFWASWNDACIETMKLMQHMHEQFGGKKVTIIGVNVLEKEDPDAIKSFLRERGITHRILLDTEDTMSDRYGFTRIPACFVIDRKGIVRASYTDKPNEKVLQGVVKKLLSE